MGKALLPRGIALAVVLLLGAGTLAVANGADKVWVPGWKSGSSMNEPRAGAAAVVHNDFIYVLGGVDGRRFSHTTEYARVRDDGSLGPWRYTSPLPAPRGFSDAVVHDGHIYLIGGGNGPYGKHLLQSAVRARILPDGRLGPWQEEAQQMLLPRRCTKLVLDGANIFSLGGFGGTLLDSVERASIGEAGHITAWQMEPKTMTMPRYVNAVKAVNGAIYVLGGHHPGRGIGLTAVERSSLSGGHLVWQDAAPLQQGRYALGAAGHGAWLYAMGGISGAEYLSTVERARIGGDGRLIGWSYSAPLTVPMASFSTVTYRGHIYVLGGTTRQGYRTETAYASFNDEGDIGFEATPAEAAAYRRLRPTVEAAAPLPNQGTVLSTLQTNAYTYIRVKGDSRTGWLAAPKTQLAPGVRIQYSQGVYMSNFFSKELKRSFAGILFVGTVQVVE